MDGVPRDEKNSGPCPKYASLSGDQPTVDLGCHIRLTRLVTLRREPEMSADVLGRLEPSRIVDRRDIGERSGPTSGVDIATSPAHRSSPTRTRFPKPLDLPG
jgi:hypothetical protein